MDKIPAASIRSHCLSPARAKVATDAPINPTAYDGEGDQIVPINISGKKSAKLIEGAREIFYPGLPHGLTATHPDQVNADLLEFLRSVQEARKAA